MTAAEAQGLHRHGGRVHSHPHARRHRHLTAPRLSRPVGATQRAESAEQPGLGVGGDHASHGHDDGHGHGHSHGHDDSHGDGASHGHDDSRGHGHSHGLIDERIKRSREGVRAVSMSLAVLGVAALAQTAIFVASGSIALLADLIHNFGDALTAVPLGVAFLLRSQRAERLAGLAVVAAIFTSACVAAVEAALRLVHPQTPGHLVVLGLAGAIGYLGNALAARIRLRAGERLASPALIADGHHARADAYVSLAVIASALVVAIGVPVGDPLIGLAITLVILRITWQSWQTVRGGQHHHH
ncbi:MAG: cation diffusion facilitator family transporter [Solirubrobacteraceae bacterium]